MATSEPIDIEVRDKVAAGIRQKILNIATAALEGYTNVNRLQSALDKLNATSLAKMNNAAATSQQRLATATARTAAAQTQAQTAAVRLSTAQQRLAVQTANAGAAQARATLATLRLQQAQERGARTAERHSQSFYAFARNVAAAAGAGFGVAALVKMGDAYTTLQNKLQAVATSQEQVNVLTERLFEVANRTRSPVEETATAFTRFDRALKGMGKSQEESLRLTETVNKALINGGATTTEAASALLQLSQAFNAGKLQGDEFRSIAENMPIVLDAVAKATNTPINQVKKLATEGKITSEVLFKAFKLIESQVDATFAKTVPTVGQSLTVLKNQALKAFGEFDKATGFTRGLAQAILFLSDNIGILVVAGGALAAALLLAFGPPVVAAVASVVAGLGLFGGIAVGIAAAVTALAVFGDKIKVSADGVVSLLDVFRALFSYVGDAARIIAEAFEGSSSKASQAWNSFADGFMETTRTLFDITKSLGNFIIGAFVGAFNGVKIVWNKAPELFEGLWKSIANAAVTALEFIINSYQLGLRTIATALSGVAPDTAKAIQDGLDAIKITLPRFDISDAAKTAASDLADATTKAFDKDYLGDAGAAVMNRARQIAQGRLSNFAGRPGADLRGSGKNTNVAEPDKNAEKRALFLARINGELDKQLRSFGMLEEARRVQQKLDEIDIQLASKKQPLLTQTERDLLEEKLKQIEANKRIQDSMDAIYDNINGPQRNFNAGMQATTELLQRGYISADKAAEAQRRLTYEFEQATDPLFDFNRGLADQNKLLDFNADQREIESDVLNISNQLAQRGIQLTNEQTDAMKAQLAVLQQRSRLRRELDNIEAQTSGARDQLITQQQALNIKIAEGGQYMDYYQRSLNRTAVELANLNLSTGIGTWEDSVLASLGRVTEGFTNFASGATSAMGDFFTSLTDGFANSVGRAIVYSENLGDALRSVAQSALAELISALVKVGLQYLINQAIGAAALAAGTAAQVGAASAVAAAWAPAAAMVSLASYGANAIPANAALIETNVLSAALAQVKGFAGGGYTGDYGIGKIAGVVHGQEFVMNADATSRNRATLEAMNRGDSVGMGGDIVIENYGTPQTYERAPSMTPGEVRLIARDVVQNEAPMVVAGDLRNPNSRTSKAMRETHSVTRKR